MPLRVDLIAPCLGLPIGELEMVLAPAFRGCAGSEGVVYVEAQYTARISQAFSECWLQKLLPPSALLWPLPPGFSSVCPGLELSGDARSQAPARPTGSGLLGAGPAFWAFTSPLGDSGAPLRTPTPDFKH